MAILNLRIYPDPLLKQHSTEVVDFGEPLHSFMLDMLETMRANQGVGLAAPQVGVLKRVIVIDVDPGVGEPLLLANPTIISTQGSVPSEEGCLCVPGYREVLKRNESVTVTAQNYKGEALTFNAEGLLAICFQHEIDHLDGILFVDRISRIKKEFFKRWMKKRTQVESEQEQP